jgi:hypothetical protein
MEVNMVCRSGPKRRTGKGGYRGKDSATAALSNFSGDVDFAPSLLRKPSNIRSLVEAVAEATEQGKSLHAMGSLWSYEDCAAADDVMVALDDLLPRDRSGRLISPQITGVVDDGFVLRDEWNALQESGPNALVHYPAGIALGDLISDLASHSLAMPTLGGSRGQTLAGAISTSVHGGDWNQPPICDIVKAIHLVAASGQEFWIESSSAPLTKQDQGNAALLKALPCATTTVIRDDKVFNAVRVACGRFGVIFSVVLEVVPQFRLVQFVTNPAKNDILQALRQGQGTQSVFTPLLRLLAKDVPPPSAGDFSDATGVPYFFQVLFSSQRPDDVWVTRRWVTSSINPPVLADVPADIHSQAQSGADPTGAVLNALRTQIVIAAQLALLGIVVPIGGTASALAAGLAGVLLGPAGVALVTAASIQTAQAVTALSTQLNVLLAQGASLGEVAAAAVNALWQIPGAAFAIPEIEKILLNAQGAGLGGTLGRGFHSDLTAGTPANYYVGEAIEIIFDAASGDYLDFLDEIFPIAPFFHQAGYISLRPSRASSAFLSMHNVTSQTRTISIEIGSLKGLDGNAGWFAFVQQRGIAHNGRPHWGLINKLDAGTVAIMYPSLNDWREALNRINGTSTLFSNAFSVQRGLEPESIVRTVTCVIASNGSVTHLGNASEYWSPVPIQQALDEIIQGRMFYFPQLGSSLLPPLIAIPNAAGGMAAALNPVSQANLMMLPRCHFLKTGRTQLNPPKKSTRPAKPPLA